MKRTLSILIIFSLLLSGCSYRVFREEAAPAEFPVDAPLAPTAAPAPTPEPGLTEEEARNRVLVGYRDQQETYPAEGGGTLLSFSCRTPQISIPGKEAEESAINSLLLALTDAYIQGSDMEGDIQPGLEPLLKEAADLHEEMGSENWIPFAKERNVYVARGDAAVLSFVYDSYSNRAGAHGDTLRTGVNFDVEAGRELLFADLAADEEALRSLCLQTMQAQAAQVSGLYEDYASTLPQLIRDGNWYFNDKGLVIFANTYDIAPYAAGIIEFSISYKSLSGILHERWQRPAKETVQGGIDGSMAREQSLGSSKAVAELKLSSQGDDIILWANNSVYDVRINAVVLREESGLFAADTEYFYLSRMDDGEYLRLMANIPEGIPNLSVSWRLPEGTLQRLLISRDGVDGSLLLIDPMSLDTLPPLELHPGDSAWRDLNRDSLGETTEFLLADKGCELRISYNGQYLSKHFDYSSEQVLWIANADGNSDMELLVSGKKADGSYETRVFRLSGDITPLPFLLGDEEQESIPERLVRAENGCFYTEGQIDILGSYTALCRYTAGPQGGLTPVPEGAWELENNESWLKTAADLKVTLADGSERRLSSGTEIRLTAIGTDYAEYETREGQTGSFTLQYDSAKEEWLADGIAENSAFVGLPYKK